MYSQPVEISDAVITAISHKMKDGSLVCRILVVGELSWRLAAELDVRGLVFLENGAPKQGFAKLELSTGCAAFRAVFEADPALKQSFEITGDSSDKYVIERGAEDVLRLKFRLNYSGGDPHKALAYMLAVGDSASLVRIIPLQQELDLAQESDVSVVVKHDGKTFEQPIPKETVRQAFAASRRDEKEAARQSLISHQTKKTTRELQ
jgi:hypothetical protein